MIRRSCTGWRQPREAASCPWCASARLRAGRIHVAEVGTSGGHDLQEAPMSTTTSAASLTAAPGRLPADVLGQVDGYLAVGIDPDRATIFAHSQIEPLNQLLVPLLSQGPQRPASAGPCSRRRR